MKRVLIMAAAGLVALAGGVAIAVAATAAGRAATVSVKHVSGMGSVLVDAKGRALYRNDQEHGAKVLCKAGCLSFWQPLVARGKPTGRSLPGRLGVLPRPDGSNQVTYRGKRLYTFTLDHAGKVTGDGFKDAFGGQKFTWHVARPAAGSGGSAPATTSTPTYTYP